MEKKKTITDKIQKASRILSIFVKIAKIVCMISIGFVVASIVYVMICGNIDLLVWNDKIILHSPIRSSILSSYDSWQMIGILVAMMVSLILATALLNQARIMFADMSQDHTPFMMKNVKRIKKIAIYYLIISLLDIQTVESITDLSFSMNTVGILGAAIFWCIALVFEYGCELQKEADETL